MPASVQGFGRFSLKISLRNILRDACLLALLLAGAGCGEVLPPPGSEGVPPGGYAAGVEVEADVKLDLLFIGPLDTHQPCTFPARVVRNAMEVWFYGDYRVRFRLLPEGILAEASGGREYAPSEYLAGNFRLARELGKRAGADFVYILERICRPARDPSETDYLLDLSDPAAVYREEVVLSMAFDQDTRNRLVWEARRALINQKARSAILQALLRKAAAALMVARREGGERAPLVMIAEPQPGEVTGREQARLQAIVTADRQVAELEVRVNGELLPLRGVALPSATVRIREMLPLRLGRNVVELAAVDDRGKRALRRVELTRAEPPRIEVEAPPGESPLPGPSFRLRALLSDPEGLKEARLLLNGKPVSLPPAGDPKSWRIDRELSLEVGRNEVVLEARNRFDLETRRRLTLVREAPAGADPAEVERLRGLVEKLKGEAEERAGRVRRERAALEEKLKEAEGRRAEPAEIERLRREAERLRAEAEAWAERARREREALEEKLKEAERKRQAELAERERAFRAERERLARQQEGERLAREREQRVREEAERERQAQLAERERALQAERERLVKQFEEERLARERERKAREEAERRRAAEAERERAALEAKLREAEGRRAEPAEIERLRREAERLRAEAEVQAERARREREALEAKLKEAERQRAATLAERERALQAERERLARQLEEERLTKEREEKARQEAERKRIAELLRRRPATIFVRRPKEGERFERETVHLEAAVSSEVGLARVEVFLNGRPVGPEASRDIGVSPKEPLKEREVSLLLRPKLGQNELVVAATTEAGVRSERLVRITREPPVGSIYAVVIGVNAYRKVQPLRWAANDARAFYDYLVADLGVPRERVRLLLDQEVTLANLRTALGTWLPRRAGENDTALIFFAGHGATEDDPASPDGDSLSKYILPADADIGNLYGSAFPMDEVGRVFSRIRSRRVLFIGDTCYSGAAGGRTPVRLASRAVKLSEGFLERLSKGEGRVILTASGPNELAKEDDTLKHGVFTYHLLQALRQKEADLNGDGYISLSEAYAHVSREVPRATGQSQRPVMKGEVTGELVLGKVGGR